MPSVLNNRCGLWRAEDRPGWASILEWFDIFEKQFGGLYGRLAEIKLRHRASSKYLENSKRLYEKAFAYFDNLRSELSVLDGIFGASDQDVYSIRLDWRPAAVKSRSEPTDSNLFCYRYRSPFANCNRLYDLGFRPTIQASCS